MNWMAAFRSGASVFLLSTDTMNRLEWSISIWTHEWWCLHWNQEIDSSSFKTFRIDLESVWQIRSKWMRCFIWKRKRKSETSLRIVSFWIAQWPGSRSNRSCGWSHENFNSAMLSKHFRKSRKRWMSSRIGLDTTISLKSVNLRRTLIADSGATRSIAV